jgi:hypothetical protein
MYTWPVKVPVAWREEGFGETVEAVELGTIVDGMIGCLELLSIALSDPGVRGRMLKHRETSKSEAHACEPWRRPQQSSSFSN